MTGFEIAGIVILALAFMFCIFIAIDDVDMAFGFFIAVLGVEVFFVLCSVILTSTSVVTPRVTASVPAKIMQASIVGHELYIYTEGGAKLTFSEYKDVEAWKEEKPLKKVYLYKKNVFGPDINYSEYSF